MRSRQTPNFVLGLVCCGASLATVGHAAQLAVAPAQDSALYQIFFAGPKLAGACNSESNSNALGSNVFSGFNVEQPIPEERRALLRFDLTAIPPGATIQSAAVTLDLNRSAPQASDEDFGLHRVRRRGQGTSNADSAGGGGDGVAAAANDPTWCERFFPGTFWASEGGDFVPAASAVTSVGTVPFQAPLPAPYTWGSNAAMVADVQGWVNNPATSNGWILVDAQSGPVAAHGEGVPAGTARRFDSLEATNAALRPQLIVTYGIGVDVPAKSGWGLMLLAGLLAAAGFLAVARLR